MSLIRKHISLTLSRAGRSDGFTINRFSTSAFLQLRNFFLRQFCLQTLNAFHFLNFLKMPIWNIRYELSTWPGLPSREFIIVHLKYGHVESWMKSSSDEGIVLTFYSETNHMAINFDSQSNLFAIYLYEFFEVFVFMLPSVEGHKLCLIIRSHSGHSLCADRTIIILVDVLMSYHLHKSKIRLSDSNRRQASGSFTISRCFCRSQTTNLSVSSWIGVKFSVVEQWWSGFWLCVNVYREGNGTR